MPLEILRRDALLLLPALGLAPLAAGAPPTAPVPGPEPVAPTFDKQDPAMVQAVVGAAHRDLQAVKDLVAARPELAKAAVDWGFGDWESALGAASHTGRREIALFLMEHGARPDIFTFAMLGHTDAVRSLVEAIPGIQRTHGPHGITLLRHARAGGDAARETIDYLQQLGDADTGPVNLPLTPDQRRVYLGDYTCADAQRFSITQGTGSRDDLQFRIGEGSPRFLNHLGDHAFSPVGAPGVTFRFAVKDASATGVRIESGTLIAEAVRA
jgi:hypothetical protein